MTRPTGAGWALVAVALVGFGAAALGVGVPATDGQRAAVDETQYLLTALSLAEDADLDIADELAERRWQAFSDVEPPVQTATRADARAISPHDPLLPLLLAGPVALGGWVGAKFAMAVCAGALAATTLWTAVRRFAVPVGLATVGVGIAAASAPLAVYGQQLYPELPAALLVLLGVVALTAARANLVLLGAVVTALPWLSVKYVFVGLALVGMASLRGRQRREVALLGAALAVMGVVYVVVHQLVWGGWTVYASGDHFVGRGGELAVLGDDVSLLGRSVRVVAVLVDADYGLAAWQPGYLLAVPAVAALLVRRLPWTGALLVPLATGWLVATFVAATMHGFWWPGRHVVAVLPLMVLVVLVWLASAGRFAQVGALALGTVGVGTYGGLLAAGYRGSFTWVLRLDAVATPWHALLPDYRGSYLALHLAWCAVLIGLAAAAIQRTRRRRTKVHSS